MKIMIPRESDGDEIDTWLYNRDNGTGAAEEVVDRLVQPDLTPTESSASIDALVQLCLKVAESTDEMIDAHKSMRNMSDEELNQLGIRVIRSTGELLDAHKSMHTHN